jgi:hypothetical protein
MSEDSEIREPSKLPGAPVTYDDHRENARAMDDETLLKNRPHLSNISPWAMAMRDEIYLRGL